MPGPDRGGQRSWNFSYVGFADGQVGHHGVQYVIGPEKEGQKNSKSIHPTEAGESIFVYPQKIALQILTNQKNSKPNSP